MITQKYVNQIAYKIVGCAMEVHKQLGSGLLESVYQACMVEELKLQGLQIATQVEVPIYYKDKLLIPKLRLDILVENLVIIELKSVEYLIPLHQAQLLTYLKLAEKPKGLLINFNTVLIKQQLVPLVTERFAALPKE
jgi:GxxExxY protein